MLPTATNKVRWGIDRSEALHGLPELHHGVQNPRTARRATSSGSGSSKWKWASDGDEVWPESPVKKARAKVKLTQCTHPQVVGVGGHFGHWALGMPVSRGKGINFNSLCPTDLEHIDTISGSLDHCVQVKVYMRQGYK